MKLNKISTLMLAAIALASCSDIDDQKPAGGVYTLDQIQETNVAIPSRAMATFNGMFTMMGAPYATYGSSQGRADDFGYISASFSNDIEAADVVVMNSNYNWFSTAAEFTSRTANYANPYMRYKIPYNQIGMCNEIIADSVSYSDAQRAQAKAMRAFAYMNLAQNFAFGYTTDKAAPCIPLLKTGVDYTNNPRATVEEVFAYVLEDLDAAITVLDAETEKRTDKTRIDGNVAHGLRARAYLAMGEWAKAAADADKAMDGYKPASISEVSAPSFYNLNDHNWMWGIMEDAGVGASYATSASWIGSFSGSSYSAGTGCYACINILLWNKISDSDVRKGWWVDADLKSPLLEGQEWNCSDGTASGQGIATFAYADKVAFLPYTNVKFGMKSGLGSSTNNNDWPLMRVEEMYLIKAEGLCKSGDKEGAKNVLIELMKYRDPKYDVDGRGLSLEDEIWFQRRVELWGEGFGTWDVKRLHKPVVRFHEGKETNWPDAFMFNLAADDGWLNMRFSQRETDNNKAIVDNTGGNLPIPGQNGNLRDGVTD